MVADYSDSGRIMRTDITFGNATNKWLRNDGSWTAPAAADVGAMRVYRSVTELELTSGSATLSGIWAAMASESMLVCQVTELASGERPVSSAAGILTVCKYDATTGYIEFHGKAESDLDYRMFLNSSGVPGGTWTALPKQIESGQENFTVGAGAYVDKDVAFTRGFSVTPIVMLTILSDSTAVSDMGNITAVVKTGRTTSGFTIRVFNGGGASRQPIVMWLAIG